MSQLQTSSNKTVTHVIYGLYAFGMVVGVSTLVAIVMNYVKRADVQGTWLESHFIWQIRTFWYGFAGIVIGGLATFILIGWGILLFVGLWFVYRIVKGWLALVDNKPIETPEGLF